VSHLARDASEDFDLFGQLEAHRNDTPGIAAQWNRIDRARSKV